MRGSETFSPKERERRERREKERERASGETEKEKIRASSVCTLFRVSARAGEYDGGDVSLNIWRGRDFKRTRVTALGRRLNNAKSTYSPAVPSHASVSFFSSFFLFSLSLILSVSFIPFFPLVSLSLLHFSFSQSHTVFVACFLLLYSIRTISRTQSASPLFSIFPFLYSIIYCIIVLFFVSYIFMGNHSRKSFKHR